MKKYGSIEEYQKFFKGEEAGTYGAYVNSNNFGRKDKKKPKRTQQGRIVRIYQKIYEKYAPGR